MPPRDRGKAKAARGSLGRRGGAYFFPGYLTERLARIPDYPLTLVEAPSGFGKTTAVREFLRNLRDARAHWYTCLGEPPSKIWQNICRLFEKVDADAADDLRELYPFADDALADVADIMRGVRGDGEIFLVADNCQLFGSAVPDGLADALSVHGAPGLHIVLITQTPHSSPLGAHNANIHRMAAGDFVFDRESAAMMFHSLGIEISDDELERVRDISGGWVAAMRVQADNYKRTGELINSGDMGELVDVAVCGRMDARERDFLTGLSLLDGFTIKQAAIINGTSARDADALPEDTRLLLKNSFFISYIEDKDVYSMHAILREHLRRRLGEKPARFAKKLNRLAGEASAAAGDYFGAAGFFLAAGEHDAALSLPFTPAYMIEVKERDVAGLLERIVSECGEAVMLRHPFAVIRCAFQFLQAGQRALFARMMLLLQKFLAAPSGASDDDIAQLRGEAAILKSFTEYNDIERMSVCHREAMSYLREKSGASRTVVFGTTPWTFGITSVLYMFWREVGKLDAELASMDECLPYYTELSGGHGSGADGAFRAAAHLMRGDDVSAGAAARAAWNYAERENQESICLCAELILGRAAILRGDEKIYDAVRKSVAQYAFERGRALKRMTELCEAELDMATGSARVMPDWLRDAGAIRKTLHIQGHSYGFMLHGKYLLAEGRHAELYALTDLVMGLAREMNYLLPGLYHLIYLAVAHARDGEGGAAAEHLAEALRIALPDEVSLPFAEFGAEMIPLLEAAGIYFDERQIGVIIALCERHASGAEKIARRMYADGASLTSREREVARLAREGLRTREIASRLFISENTVKSALKAVYGKLGINSRARLAGKEF